MKAIVIFFVISGIALWLGLIISFIFAVITSRREILASRGKIYHAEQDNRLETLKSNDYGHEHNTIIVDEYNVDEMDYDEYPIDYGGMTF